MNNKRIKAFLLIACIINLTITNCIPVYATVPGVVEAESIWLTLETIALNMGVTLEFMPDKSISYNNEQKKQELIEYIDWELSEGVITQSQHDAAIDNLGNLTGVNGSHVGVGDVINLGADLWASLSRFFYEKYIYASPDLTGTLSSSAKALFDAYSGPCAIYAVLDGDRPTIIVLSPYCLQSPIKGREYANVTYWQLCDGPSSETVHTIYNDGVTGTWQANMGNLFVGRTISVQYFANKAVNEDIIVNDGENALVSSPTYDDYTNRLNDVFSISNGHVVVTDTGEAPTVLDGDTIADTVADIQDGVTSWENAIPAIQAAEGDTTGDIVGENSVIGKKALDELVTGLNVSQIQNKFPFCIPSDLKEIASGAASVSGNAPVITIPLKLEFAGTTYYEDSEAVVIDFKDFSQLALIFRKGFLLLFLVGMIYLSIYVISSFFHVTE